MNRKPCSASLIEASLRASFAGVSLGDGVSIRQSEIIANYGEGCTDGEYAALPKSEVTDDWCAIPDAELERAHAAFFDPPAFRYYIPALILSVLRNYDGGTSMRIIGTLGALCPERQSYEMANATMWALLSHGQRKSIALALRCFQQLVQFEFEEPEMVSCAYAEYWQKYEEGGEGERSET